jgi:hypothetical protein
VGWSEEAPGTLGFMISRGGWWGCRLIGDLSRGAEGRAETHIMHYLFLKPKLLSLLQAETPNSSFTMKSGFRIGGGYLRSDGG